MHDLNTGEGMSEGESRKPRETGSWKGKVWLSPDWDSDETNEEIAQLFYGGDDESDPLLKPPDPQA
jgi:hypothetical protein